MGTVLVFDAEHDWCTLLKRLLERDGHVVVTCADQADALAWAKSRALDLAIISVGSDRDQSVRLAQQLKSAREGLRTMIIADYLSDEEAQRTTADDSLISPAEIEAIEAKVRELLHTVEMSSRHNPDR
jgi:DNA-binding response OmpR family regulator